MVLHQGFTYCRHNKFEKKIDKWECCSRRHKKCQAKVVIDSSGMIKSGVHAHTHPPPTINVVDGEYVIKNERLGKRKKLEPAKFYWEVPLQETDDL